MRLRPHLHGNVCVYVQYAFSKKPSVHTQSAQLTCPFTRDPSTRWKRCSTYAGPVSGAAAATKYTKSSEEDPGAWLPSELGVTRYKVTLVTVV